MCLQKQASAGRGLQYVETVALVRDHEGENAARPQKRFAVPQEADWIGEMLENMGSRDPVEAPVFTDRVPYGSAVRYVIQLFNKGDVHVRVGGIFPSQLIRRRVVERLNTIPFSFGKEG